MEVTLGRRRRRRRVTHPPTNVGKEEENERNKNQSPPPPQAAIRRRSVGRSIGWTGGGDPFLPHRHTIELLILNTRTHKGKKKGERETPTQHKVEKRNDRSISDLNKRKESGRSLCSRLTSNSDVVVTMIQVDRRVAGGIVTTRSSRILLSVERADDGRNGAHVSDRHDRRWRGASGGNDEKLLLLLLLLRWSRRRTGYGCNILNGFNLGRNDHHGRFFNQLAATVVVHLSLLLLLLAVDNNQTHRDAQLID